MTNAFDALLKVTNFLLHNVNNDDALNIKKLAIDALTDFTDYDNDHVARCVLNDISNYDISNFNFEAYSMKAIAVVALRDLSAPESKVQVSDVSDKDTVLVGEDIYPRVQKILVEHLGIEPDQVKLESSIIDDLGADSLDVVELIMAFEEEFVIEIIDSVAESVDTVNDIIVLLNKSMNQKEPVVLEGEEVDLARLRSKVKINDYIRESVIETVKTTLKIPRKKVRLTANLKALVPADSMKEDLRCEFQENFGIRLPKTFIYDVENFKDIMLYLSDARPFFRHS